MLHVSQKIGEGRNSIVYLLDGIAIKRMKKSLFRRDERDILKELDHKCIIKLLSSYEDDFYVYIKLEYFQGKNLYEWRTCMKEDIEIFDKVIFQLLDVIKYLHDKDIIHGDLSVRNILVNDSNEIKLIDFGNCRKTDSKNEKGQNEKGQNEKGQNEKGQNEKGQNEQEEKVSFGTFAFLSPELLSGEIKVSNKAAELWALGILIFVVITGNIPFLGHNENTVYFRIMNSKINYKKKNIPKKYKKVLKSLLRKKYNKRKIINL